MIRNTVFILTFVILPIISAQQCHQATLCNGGTFLDLTTQPDYDSCQNKCSQTNNCNWFSFCSDNGNCLEYDGCPSPVTSSTCESGEVTCSGGTESVCAESGFCIGTAVDVKTVASVQECLQECKNNVDCEWYNYYTNGNCVLLKDCERNDVQCPDCLIGEDDCPIENEFVCEESGFCVGTAVDVKTVASVQECLQECKNNVNCEWYNYYTNGNCVLLKDCERNDSQCPECLIGEDDCPLENEFVCEESGFCIGSSLGGEVVSSPNDCLRECKNVPGCEWYNFYPSNGNCFFLQDCTRNDAQCAECIIGENDCPLQNDFVCEESGFCEGTTLDVTNGASAQDCLSDCKGISGCEWYNFYTSSGHCVHLADCTRDDALCPDCIIGENDCPLDGTGSGEDMTQLMLVGGWPGSESYQVEVIDLSGNASCNNIQLRDYPFDYGSVGTYINGKPMVCGGYNIGYGTKECYTYDKTSNLWTEGPSMRTRRNFAVGASFNDGTWWVTGGEDLSKDPEVTLNSTELFNPTFQPTVDLPTPLDEHNVVKINNTHVFVFGGHLTSDSIWMFDRTKGSNGWSSVAPIPMSSVHCTGGLVKYPDNSIKLVVAGGFAKTNTFVYSLDKGTWAPGLDLPYDIAYGMSVPFGDSFLIVGGNSLILGKELDTILQFDVQTGNWTTRPEKLSEGKYSAAAILLPKSYIPCN